MPSLSDLNANAVATWGNSVEKESIERTPFWIHDITLSRPFKTDRGDEIRLYVCNITVGDPSRKAPRAVITLGITEDRAPYYEYFEERRGLNPEPVGPCITYSIPLKGGQTFWRLEEAPNAEDLEAPMFEALEASSGSRRRSR